MAYDLQKNGFRGVVHGRSFTGWWIGACDDTSWLHNVVGLLSEMASVRLATPVYVEPTEIPKPYTQKRMEFPDPWPGGWWRLRDIVDYELTLSLSLVRTAALYKEEFLFNSYQMYKNSIEKTDKNQPYAFVIPAAPARLSDDAENDRGPDVRRGRNPAGQGGFHRRRQDSIRPARSWSCWPSPTSPTPGRCSNGKNIPTCGSIPGGPPMPPYDNAGWTLPLQMGVACDQVD